MASIKDAIDDSFQDRSSIIKYFIYTIPLYLLIMFVNLDAWWYYLCAVLTGLLLFGLMVTCTNNVSNGNLTILPSFNIFGTIWTGFKGVLVLLPIGVVSYLLSLAFANMIKNIVVEASYADVICNIIYCLFASVVITSYMLYSNKLKFLDAYKVKILFEYSFDVLLAVAFMLVLVVIFNIIVIVPITYILWLFMGLINPVSIFAWCFFAVVDLAIIANYLAQICYEKIEIKLPSFADNGEDDEKKDNKD